MHKRSLRFHHHVSHYVMLFLILAISFFAFVECSGDSVKQLYVGILAGIMYLLWGLFHHWQDDDLNWIIVVEYVSLTMFGITVLWVLLANVY